MSQANSTTALARKSDAGGDGTAVQPEPNEGVASWIKAGREKQETVGGLPIPPVPLMSALSVIGQDLNHAALADAATTPIRSLLRRLEQRLLR